MEQKNLLKIDDFMLNPKRVFKLIGWNPFDVHSESSRWIHFLRLFYMFTTNFYFVFGLVLQTVYGFAVIDQPDAFVKITNTAPIIGNRMSSKNL